MEMWLQRSTPVFLTVAVAAMVISGQEPVTLDYEIQRGVTRPFGSPLILKCNLNMTRYVKMVNWLYSSLTEPLNKSRISCRETYNRSAKTSTVVPDKRKVFNKDDQQICTTEGVSGWYFCSIKKDIPILTEEFSIGREVFITKSEEHATHPSLTITSKEASFQLWPWIVSGVSAFTLVLLVICILLRRRCRRSRAEDPIYANTRPVVNKQPSPRPRMPADTLKTASSSQNLQNPSPKRYDDDTRRYRH